MEPAHYWSYQICTSTSTPQDHRHTPLCLAGISELFRLRLLDGVLSGPDADVRDGGNMRTLESSQVYDTTGNTPSIQHVRCSNDSVMPRFFALKP